MKMRKGKEFNPYLIITVVFMLLIVVANIAVWTIIFGKVDNRLASTQETVSGQILEIQNNLDKKVAEAITEGVLNDDTKAEIVNNASDRLSSTVEQTVIDTLNEQIARDYYLPQDYTSAGLFVASKNLYNVIELTCYGRQKQNANDTSSEYNIGSQSTGTIITADGYIVTNAHCVTFINYKYEPAGNYGPFIQYNKISYIDIFPSIKGRFTKHIEEYTFTVIACDITRDLALLKLNETVPTIWKEATLANSDYVKMGEEVIALGNAQGYGINMTNGIASKFSFYDNDYQEELIQTDAAINPGNSGGALYNIRGEIIGINSSKIVSSGVEGMGFAIASNSVKEFIDSVCAEKEITVNYLYREE